MARPELRPRLRPTHLRWRLHFSGVDNWTKVLWRQHYWAA